jgi:hypothetical protein
MQNDDFDLAAVTVLNFFDRALDYLTESDVKYTTSDAIALAAIMQKEYFFIRSAGSRPNYE